MESVGNLRCSGLEHYDTRAEYLNRLVTYLVPRALCGHMACLAALVIVRLP